ncbi:MAG: hypothetical protein IPO21_08960 [Bacteroidales bacterium]|nr:hypothetical protein [Bacteroidales bacterium]
MYKKIAWIIVLFVIFSSCEKSTIKKLKFERTLGVLGSELGEFNFDSSNNIGWAICHTDSYLYVADKYNNRIQRFDNDHNFVDWIGFLNGKWGVYTEDVAADEEVFVPYHAYTNNGAVYFACDYFKEYGVVLKMNEQGEILKQMPVKIGGFATFAVDENDNVYILDDGTITKFDDNGNELLQFGGPGVDDGEFGEDVNSIFIDSKQNIIALDAENSRVQLFDTIGTFLKNWDVECGSSFYNCMGFYEGHLYVNEYDHLVKYTSDGVFVDSWRKKDFIHGQLQFIIWEDRLYEAYSFDSYISIYSFDVD